MRLYPSGVRTYLLAVFHQRPDRFPEVVVEVPAVLDLGPGPEFRERRRFLLADDVVLERERLPERLQDPHPGLVAEDSEQFVGGQRRVGPVVSVGRRHARSIRSYNI
ncbi:hypothetical protein BRC81_06985 [Halobacteriales archaeon QS_1_68_20]|nr:MAG: hypothetical protein BRC81_06985 [Halobacteriales archaeon QS_1_68_20]